MAALSDVFCLLQLTLVRANKLLADTVDDAGHARNVDGVDEGMELTSLNHLH
jgi:hypothetical protein